MAQKTILVVEDDADIRELLSFSLGKEGYNVVTAESAERAERVLQRTTPDVILLDLMLPQKDGFTFCKELRANEKTAHVPILMVTAREEDADIVAGLEVGADDYVAKPFSPRILSARIKAVLRRRTAGAQDKADVVKCAPFEIDRTRHEARADGKPVVLTASEFKALDMFVRRPGIVFTRYQIVDNIHGADYPVTDRSVDVLLVGLRKKLGACGDLIETVRGIGYRLVDREKSKS
jgi:two-component system phosphate regulon response regulator PhoB